MTRRNIFSKAGMGWQGHAKHGAIAEGMKTEVVPKTVLGKRMQIPQICLTWKPLGVDGLQRRC